MRWCLTILFLLSMTACVQCEQCERAPERNFATESLLMDESMFPPGWTNSPIIPTADSHGAFEHPLRDVDGPGGVAVHEIYRYEFGDDARHEYERQLDVWFTHAPTYDEWQPREDLRASLAFADEAYYYNLI
jgi:hypothetical protein